MDVEAIGLTKELKDELYEKVVTFAQKMVGADNR